MFKRNLKGYIPQIAIAILLIYCWLIIIFTNYAASWRQYLGLALFIILIVFGFKNSKFLIIGTGVYLILATFNAIAVTPTIDTYRINFGSVSTPQIQLLSATLFSIYLYLHFDNLIDIYLDYKESKEKKNR